MEVDSTPVIALLLALAAFASLQHFFRINFWTSLVLALFAAVVALLDVLKKF